MQIDWSKLSLEILVLAAAVALVAYLWPQHTISTTAKTSPAPSYVAPASSSSTTVPAPKPRPRATSTPLSHSRGSPPSPPRSKLPPGWQVVSCRAVPAIAYSFSLDTVLAAAKIKGLDDFGVRVLTVCWNKYHTWRPANGQG